jgi:hypothetical protein
MDVAIISREDAVRGQMNGRSCAPVLPYMTEFPPCAIESYSSGGTDMCEQRS